MHIYGISAAVFLDVLAVADEASIKNVTVFMILHGYSKWPVSRQSYCMFHSVQS